jgi:uncharacterized membrane protein
MKKYLIDFIFWLFIITAIILTFLFMVHTFTKKDELKELQKENLRLEIEIKKRHIEQLK